MRRSCGDLAAIWRAPDRRDTQAAVSSARTIAPDRRRLQQATRAGLRSRSRWLGRGLLCLVLALLLQGFRTRGLTWLSNTLHRNDPLQLFGQASAGLGLVLLTLLGTAALCLLTTAALTGNLRPIEAGDLRKLKAGRRREPALAWLGLILLAISLGVHRGVLAGASRAVDATPTSLPVLWTIWAIDVLTISGALLLIGGLVELLLDERLRRQALHRSPHELREELRERR
ncbi:MAG TPA: hypothetical protein ENJ18_07200 [Nannocystis exedens]|nr:hypothetical protein [Nannocystis exedens]